MTQSEYRAYPAISRSDLMKFKKSPLHYKYAVENPTEDQAPALVFGAASHKYILERDDFDSEFAVAPNVDRRTKEGKATWQEFVDSCGDKLVITVDDFEKIKEMAKAMRKLLDNKVLAENLGIAASKIQRKIAPDVVNQSWKDYLDRKMK